MRIKFFIAVLLTILICGCYYDIEEQLYGLNAPCDTSNVTYSATIVPILQNSGCLGCHSGVSASGSIRLDSYNYLITQATNGKLYGTITHSTGYIPMPQGGNKMLPCDISKIKAWIDAGTPNN
ncbi:MAG: hypothetical protein EPN92_13965 [Chitinophagaceae bacterium]|nr:MAG: hypothetical protein EPN92_13965 [Chitinophagaceae bacterium]